MNFFFFISDIFLVTIFMLYIMKLPLYCVAKWCNVLDFLCMLFYAKTMYLVDRLPKEQGYLFLKSY